MTSEATLEEPVKEDTRSAISPKKTDPLAFEKFMGRLRDEAYRNLDASEHKVDLQGWMHGALEPRIRDILNLAEGGPIRMLEVGSWKGLSSSVLGTIARERNDGSSVLCIDTWLGAPEFWTWGIDDPSRGTALQCKHGYPSVFYTFTKNMKALRLENQVIPFPISSDQGFEVLRHYNAQFDLIYVDASHEENAVLRDIENAWTVLAPGGILFGDDYSDFWPGVVSAVNRFIKSRNLKGINEEVIWYIPKPAI